MCSNDWCFTGIKQKPFISSFIKYKSFQKKFNSSISRYFLSVLATYKLLSLKLISLTVSIDKSPAVKRQTIEIDGWKQNFLLTLQNKAKLLPSLWLKLYICILDTQKTRTVCYSVFISVNQNNYWSLQIQSHSKQLKLYVTSISFNDVLRYLIFFFLICPEFLLSVVYFSLVVL